MSAPHLSACCVDDKWASVRGILRLTAHCMTHSQSQGGSSVVREWLSETELNWVNSLLWTSSLDAFRPKQNSLVIISQFTLKSPFFPHYFTTKPMPLNSSLVKVTKLFSNLTSYQYQRPPCRKPQNCDRVTSRDSRELLCTEFPGEFLGISEILTIITGNL